MFALCLPCAFGFNLWSGAFANTPMGNILGFEDFLLSNIVLPVGALIYVLFCCTKRGWGPENYFSEINKGKGTHFSRGLLHYFRTGLPALILIILVSGLVTYFQ